MVFGRIVQSVVWGLSTAPSELSEFNNGRKLTKNSTEDIKINCCLAKKAKTVETFREAIKKIINKTRVRENSRLFEHEYYSSTGNPFNLPFCFELTDKGYTLLKHRELLACVVDCNSFETACFLKDLQLLLIDTPTQRQNECTCSVDKARSFHFVANDHYDVVHAQTSDAVSTLSLLCRKRQQTLHFRLRVTEAKQYGGYNTQIIIRANHRWLALSMIDNNFII